MIKFICKKCGEEKKHYGKELCQKCYKAKYYQKYKKYIKEQVANYQKEHSEQYKERNARWQREHLEQHKKCNAKYQKENKDIVNAKTRRHNMKKLNAEGSHTVEEWKALKEEYNYCCGYCGKFCGDNLAEDHIIPISINGTNFIWNIKPACISCNSSKCDRPLHIFLEEKINRSINATT